jgi:hypothetical protein
MASFKCIFSLIPQLLYELYRMWCLHLTRIYSQLFQDTSIHSSLKLMTASS